MGIIFDKGKNTFTLHTKSSTYQMQVYGLSASVCGPRVFRKSL